MALNTLLKYLVDHCASSNYVGGGGGLEPLHGRQWDDQRRNSIKEEEEFELWVRLIFKFWRTYLRERFSLLSGCLFKMIVYHSIDKSLATISKQFQALGFSCAKF